MLQGLKGKRLLVLEDSFFLDDATRRLFEMAGVTVELVSTADVIGYLEADMSFDGVIIDINVDADTAFAVAERLEARRIPFLFAVNGRQPAETGRYSAYRLCSDIGELKAIADGLFGTQGVH